MQKRSRSHSRFIVAAVFIILSIPAVSQDIFIKGTATKKSGNHEIPLEGVSVSLKNSGRTTLTSRNGKFSLKIRESDIKGTMVVSGTNFSRREWPIPGEKVFKVVMGDIEIVCRLVIAFPAASAEPPPPPPPPPSPMILAPPEEVKTFPVPYPAPSAVYVIPWNEFTITGKKDFITVNTALTNALSNCGYTEKSYYYIRNGFALATQMEKIENNGTPKPEPERWSNKITAEKNSFLEYLRSLYSAPEGYFRIIVFLVTDIDLTASNETIDREQAMEFVKQGYASLPGIYRNMAFTNNHITTVLVYEFKKVQGRPAELINGIPGKIHLGNAGILSKLK